MVNISQIFESMDTTHWVLTGIGLLLWMGLTYLAGQFSEKHWGDRESGALIGFFIPGIIIITIINFY